jgi:hypothetical protein
MVGFERIYARLTDVVPPDIAGWVDLRRPSYWSGWGSPLNGQVRRREIVRELARAIRFDGAVETGTCRGASTEFFAALFGRVWTVESDERFFAFSRRRFGADRDVSVELGESRAFLDRFVRGSEIRDMTLFVYLDAHGGDDLPLAGELTTIADADLRSVVMIDDFQVPGDSGYGYDDYGHGKALVEEYLPASALEGWALMYPAMGSAEETGARRGCCVLASPALAEDARSPGLRLAGIL